MDSPKRFPVLQLLTPRRPLGQGLTSYLIQDVDSHLAYSVVARSHQKALADLRRYLQGESSGGNIAPRGRA